MWPSSLLVRSEVGTSTQPNLNISHREARAVAKQPFSQIRGGYIHTAQPEHLSHRPKLWPSSLLVRGGYIHTIRCPMTRCMPPSTPPPPPPPTSPPSFSFFFSSCFLQAFTMLDEIFAYVTAFCFCLFGGFFGWFFVSVFVLGGYLFVCFVLFCCCFLYLTLEVVTFRLSGWYLLGVFLLPAFTRLRHECQESVRWNACVYRLDFGLHSHPKEFWGEWSQNPC